jgi:hypothetical protein
MRVEDVRMFEPELVQTLRQIEARAKIAREQGPLSMRNALQEIIKEADECLKLKSSDQQEPVTNGEGNTQ